MRRFLFSSTLLLFCGLLPAQSDDRPLVWNAVTTNEDGTACTDLAGYEVGLFAAGATPNDAGTHPIRAVAAVGTETWIAKDLFWPLFSGAAADDYLPDGDYIISVRARDQAGNHSRWSETIQITWTRTVENDVHPNAPPGLQVETTTTTETTTQTAGGVTTTTTVTRTVTRVET